MQQNQVVLPEEWLAARKELLAKEKEFTRLRDQLSQQRRELPWAKVDKEYVFEGPDGPETLSDLFAGRSQLIVYHFMYGPEWDEGCKSCSFMADNYDNIIVHLNQRDVTMVTISRAPLETLLAFQKRMGWHFKWLSSASNEFNFDYHVSATPEEMDNGGMYYNYRQNDFVMEEAPGATVFYKDEAGNIYHTYSTYGRGLDMFLTAYHYLDLVPKGRDEDGRGMFWVRHHDKYENGSPGN
jgi:predicted dithiol-disulfide oxidoreductase (DUF899 family)